VRYQTGGRAALRAHADGDRWHVELFAQPAGVDAGLAIGREEVGLVLKLPQHRLQVRPFQAASGLPERPAGQRGNLLGDPELLLAFGRGRGAALGGALAGRGERGPHAAALPPAPSWPRALRAWLSLDRTAALVAGLVHSAPATAAASVDQLGRGRLRPAPLHPQLTNYFYAVALDQPE
jgi:hypothetical protein